MVVKKSVLALWSTIKEALSTPEFKTLTSLLKDFKHRRIDKTQLIASSQLLFNDEFLHRCFTDFLNGKQTQEEEQEDEEDEEEQEEQEEQEDEDRETVSKKLNQSESLKLVSSIKELDKQKMSHSEFRKSLQLLFENKGQEDEHGKTKQDVEDTDLEEGKVREERLLRDTKVGQAESNRLAARTEVDEKSKEDAVHHCDTHIGLVVPDQRESDKMNLEGKKRGILQQEPIVRSPKKMRTSRRLHPVTPSYKLILDEEPCPVSYPVLNNECSLKKFGDDMGRRTLTNYEEAMANCEEEMYEANMLMETLKSAVEKADKVIRKEMRVKNLGVKFFKCIEWLCDRDMREIVTEHHDQMLPVMSRRLKQKLDELTVARRQREAVWKKVLKENTAKQRESTGQAPMKK